MKICSHQFLEMWMYQRIKKQNFCDNWSFITKISSLPTRLVYFSPIHNCLMANGKKKAKAANISKTPKTTSASITSTSHMAETSETLTMSASSSDPAHCPYMF